MTLSPTEATALLERALQTALVQESQRGHALAAATLDAALREATEADAPLRMRALVLRADLAVTLNVLGEALGILAEAKHVPLSPSDRESLESELRRIDDLEVFLTHRGCAG